MKKRLSLLSLALVFVILMTSCGDSSNNRDKGLGGLFPIHAKLTTEQAQKYACTIAVGTSMWIDSGVVKTKDRVAGLRKDGTVVVAGDHDNFWDVSSWNHIKAISAYGGHLVGLRTNGTVVATGSNDSGECDVSEWNDIVAIAAGYGCTIGLRSDGTVVAAGEDYCGECDVSDWNDIVAVASGESETMGLRSDGTVISTYYDESAYSDWEDIVDIAVGFECAGLKSDGTLRAQHCNMARNNTFPDDEDLSDWTDIVYIDAYLDRLLGLRSDGTVTLEDSYNPENGEKEILDWKNIVAVKQGIICIGLKSDGTVVATSVENEMDVVNEVSSWENIGIPSFDDEDVWDNEEPTDDLGNEIPTAGNIEIPSYDDGIDSTGTVVTSFGGDVDIGSTDPSVISNDAYYKIKCNYFEYDNEGKSTDSIESTLYYDRNNEYLMSTYIRNDQEVLSGRACNNYDEEGNLISQQRLWLINNSDSTYDYQFEKYVYGKNGVLISDRVFDSHGTLKYELTSVVDDENRPVSSVEHVISRSGNPEDDSYTTYEFSELDAYGNYTKKAESSEDEWKETTKYVYNSSGKVTREDRILEFFDEYGSIISEHCTDTEYDESGRITKTTIFSGIDYDGDGKFESECDNVSERVSEYSYYPDSMSYLITTYLNGVLHSIEAYDYDAFNS